MTAFRIAAVQIASVRGDIDRNLASHVAAIRESAQRRISVLVFPELSLTGYELDLAAELAMTVTDPRLAELSSLARQLQIEIVVGAPLRQVTAKPSLGSIVFAADGTTSTYCKMHLGGSEPNYFTPGDRPFAFAVNGLEIGLAICADTSQSSHPQRYADAGAGIYAASMFLTDEWYRTDAPRLASYAARFQMLIVMANHSASVGTYSSVGKSSVWGPDGALLAQAEGSENSLVIATFGHASWNGEVVRI